MKMTHTNLGEENEMIFFFLMSSFFEANEFFFLTFDLFDDLLKQFINIIGHKYLIYQTRHNFLEHFLFKFKYNFLSKLKMNCFQ